MKQEIPKEDGKLKHYCNESHYFVADKVERLFRTKLNRTGHKVLATIEGIVAGFLVAYAGESAVDLINHYGANINSEILAYIGLGMVAGTAGVTRIVAPRPYRAFLDSSPIYPSGVMGVMTGASIKALETLPIKETLEKLLL